MLVVVGSGFITLKKIILWVHINVESAGETVAALYYLPTHLNLPTDPAHLNSFEEFLISWFLLVNVLSTLSFDFEVSLLLEKIKIISSFSACVYVADFFSCSYFFFLFLGCLYFLVLLVKIKK